MPEPQITDQFGLTPLQRDLLLIIQEMSANGVAPTIREIMHEADYVSVGHIHEALCGLNERGYVDWITYRHRSIRVLRRIKPPEEPVFVGFFEDEEKVREFVTCHVAS